MKLTKEEVEHIALLARLQLSEEEKELYRVQLSSILAYVDQLGELDTTDVPPMTSVLSNKMKLREDIPVKGLSPEQIMINAPQTDENHFRVPLVLDQEENDD